jgi:hypothetical protein
MLSHVVLRQAHFLLKIGDTMRILSCLLLACSLLLVGCGESETASDSVDTDVEAKQKQDADVAAIRKLGGRVTFDEKNPGKPLVGVTLHGPKVTDARLVHLKGLTSLQSLEINTTPVTDAGLVHLKGLTSLQELSLGGTKVTDAGLEHLKGLTGLQTLVLIRTKVTGAGVKSLLAELPKCRIRK